MSKEILNDSTAFLGTGWHEHAAEIVAWDDDWQTEVEEHGSRLATAVIKGTISLGELRDGVSFANSLDKEAVQLLRETDLVGLSTGDRCEIMARRLAHHSGRWALEQVKTESKRLRWGSYVGRTSQDKKVDIGMGRFETHDMDDRAVATTQTEVE